MKSYLYLLAVLSFAAVSDAYAHAHLERSQPARNSTVSVLPKNVVLEFNEAVQMTALTLQAGEGKARDLGPLPKVAGKEITVPMPMLAAGRYIIKWRAVGDDNHVRSGEISFTVTAK